MPTIREDIAALIVTGVAGNVSAKDLRDSFFKIYDHGLINKGVIVSVLDITETGIYEGTNIGDTIITGEVMILAHKDQVGNIGYLMMEANGTMHTGGKPAGGAVVWHEVVKKAHSTGEVQIEIAGGFTTVLTNTFTNELGTTDLMDGEPHAIKLVMKAGSPDIPDHDANWGYILPHQADHTGSPVRLLSGGLAGTPNGTLKIWIEKDALVTIKKVDKADIESAWEVVHVDIPANAGHTQVGHIPAAPTADGDYKLHVAAGVITWVAAT